MQWHWVKDVAEDRNEAFDSAIRRAAGGVKSDLEKKSAVTLISNRFGDEAFWEFEVQGSDSENVSFKSVIHSTRFGDDSLSREVQQFTREILLSTDDEEESVQVITTPGREERVLIQRVETHFIWSRFFYERTQS